MSSQIKAPGYEGVVNWLLIALCVVVVIITSLFLFFWNRLLGWLFGFVLRTLWWKSSNVWIDMDAIQFSLLAGRVMIKDFRYHSINQSIRIIKFHITWRYWFWRSRVESDSAHVEIPGEVVEGKSHHLPCRLQAVAEGVEWFIYNRTPAYDDILRHMQPDPPEILSRRPGTSESAPLNDGETSALPATSEKKTNVRKAKKYAFWPLTPVKHVAKWIFRQLPIVDLKETLPIGFEITRGAITLGNDSMPNIFISNFKRASGTFGLQPSRSKLDPYKQVYNFKFRQVRIYTRVNRDHDRPMRERGQMVVEEMRRISFISKFATLSAENFFIKAFHLIAPRLFRVPGKVEPPTPGKKWAGLSRYYTQNEKTNKPNAHEYAKLSTLLETPMLDLTYYADVAGQVPADPVRIGRPGLEAMDVGNGDLAPEWGVDLVIHGGQANYGPWMDRQRRSFQEVFFPATFYPRRSTETLHPGQNRLHVALKIFVEVRDELKLRLPTRELSKNWRYDDAGDLGPSKLASRPFGWFDLLIGANSNVTYDMAMVAHELGYETMLQVHLDTVSMSSSVNQSRFLYADSCRVTCEMPSPLQWNEHREWQFHVSFTRPVIHLLRDHVALITDLSKDWTSGPPIEYARFVPITYSLRLTFKDIRLGIYLNDHNVIDYPLVDSQNTLLWLTGPVLSAEVCIPTTKYRPMSPTVHFSVEAAPLDACLTLPSWNTNALLATKATQSVAQIGSMVLRGSYMYFADVVPGNVDMLKIDVNARDLLFKAHGRTVHHLIRLRENYFGNFTNFSTRSEYMDKHSRGMVGDPMVLKYRKGKSNMFQVSIRVDIQDSAILFPLELHDFKSATLVYIPQIQIGINLHDHFMDLTANSGLLRVTNVGDCSSVKMADFARTRFHGLFISDFEVCGNRLFGPPPQNATYLAVYEVNLGQLSGSASSSLVNSIAVSATTFATGFQNVLDTVAEEYRLVFEPDVTFVKISVKSADLTWSIPQAAIRLSVPSGIRYDSNDLAGRTYKHIKSVVVPSVKLRCLLAQTPNTPRLLSEWFEIASASFDINADIYGAPPNWKADAQRQRIFVQSQDMFTSRASWIYGSNISQASGYRRDHSLLLPVVTMPRLPHGVAAERSAADGSSTAGFETASSSELTSQSDSDDDTENQLSFNAGRRRVSQFFADPFAGNDEDLSSGDESDDGDDTSVPSTSDDGSMLLMTSGLNAYKRVLPTYRSLPIDVGPTFVMESPSNIPPVLAVPLETDVEPRHETSSPLTSEAFNDSDDTTIIRVQSKETSELLLTPMAATVFQTIIEEQRKQIASPDFELDEMFHKFMSSPSHPSYSPKKRFFHARLSRSTLTVLQTLQLDPDLDSTLFEEPTKPSSPPLGLLTATLVEGRCSGVVGDVVAIINAAYSSAALDLRLGKAPLRATAPSVSSGQMIAHTSSIVVKSDSSGLSVNPILGEVRIDLPHWAPSILYQFSSAFVEAFSPVASRWRELQDWTVRYRRELSQTLLQAVCDVPGAADPLSRTQVSFMVNSGTPKELRADPSLTILAHMRSALRRVGLADIAQAQSPAGHVTEDIAEEEFRIFLTQMSRRSLVDLHPDDASDTFFYRQLYPITSAGQRGPFPLPLALRLSCQRVLLDLGGAVDMRNRLELGPGNIRVQLAERIFATSQPLEANKSSTSVSSLVPDQPVLHAVITGSLALFTATLHPSLLSVIEGIIRLNREHPIRQLRTSPAASPRFDDQTSSHPKRLLVEMFVDMEEFEVRALAQVLSVGMKLKGGHLSVSFLEDQSRPPWTGKAMRSGNVSARSGFREFSIQARSTQDEAETSHVDRATLASITILDGELFAATDLEYLRGTFTLNTLKLAVPRSALKLYTFVKQWEAEYLPSYDAMFKKLLSEIDDTSSKAPPRPSFIALQSIDFQVQINHLGVYLHVMHGTWFSWSLEDTLAYSAAKDSRAVSYGVQLASQRIVLSGEPDGTGPLVPPSHSVKLALPSLRLQGVIQSDHIQASLTIDHFRLMLKPQYVDDILVVQQKFGSDFNELIDVFAYNRPKKPQSSHPSSLTFDVALKLEGFRIGIQGPTSTQYLQSPMVSASYQSLPPSGSQLHLDVKGLELSLVHDVHPLSSKREEYNSASMSLDCVVHNEVPQEALDSIEYLTINVSRVHALMAPAAISELGDLVDHVQAEMLQRKRDRALELEEMRSKTRHVIKTFEGPAVHARPRSAFRNRIISLAVERIGIAFPLSIRASDGPTSVAPSLHRGKEPVPAFLFSIASLSFVTQREESGNARMSNFAFQFVPTFDPGRPEHFGSASHSRLNCMLYPEMSADVRSDTSTISRQVLIRAAVSGFELDLSPSLPAYIFALIDVYRDGKEQFERFLPQSLDSSGHAPAERRSNSVESDYPTIRTSEITTSLDFQSGRVQFHVNDSIDEGNGLTTASLDPTFPDPSLPSAIDSDVFALPNVSVWFQYRATPALHKISSTSSDIPPSRLTFNAVIHSSQNTIQPSLLPFISAVTRHVEARLADDSVSQTRPRLPVSPPQAVERGSSSTMMGTMEMVFTLRIDQSKLDFTCLPDVYVNAGLHWKSGGFVLRIAPGAEEVSAVGSIEGISASLRHGYLVDDCVNASARGLAFAVTYAQLHEDGRTVNAVSIVVDTEIIGSVRFGRLQDILCFKAVWLDRIPVFEGAGDTTPSSPVLAPVAGQPRRAFITSVLVQVESLQLDIDLGQAITKLILDLRPIIVRSRLTDDFSEISVISQLVKLDAVRAISGRIALPNLSFETIRRRGSSKSVQRTLLELSIRTGHLTASINYEGKRILLFNSDPLQATVRDEWASILPMSERGVNLDFSVTGGNIGAAARVMTASELILLGGRVRSLLQSQREGAARESKVFAATRTPKPQNPLSMVATAMLQSARSKLKESGHLDILVVQHMYLDVSQIRLGIFNETDTRMTQFEADGVKGELIRHVQFEQTSPRRELTLALQSFEVRNGDVPGQDKWLDFMTGAKVFTMPEMVIEMQSTEYTEANRIEYDFKSTFPRPKARVGQRTLYIALDFHKYEQLMATQNAFKGAVESALEEIGKTPPRPRSGSHTISLTHTSDLPTSLEEMRRGTSTASAVPTKVKETMEVKTNAQGTQLSETKERTADTSEVIDTDVSTAPNLSTLKVGMRGLTYHCRSRSIETPKLHQLGAASPDLETFKQWTNISIRDSLPVWVHEYATVPIEQIMRSLLEVYIKQLKQQKEDDLEGV